MLNWARFKYFKNLRRNGILQSQAQEPWYSEAGRFFGPGYLKEYQDVLPEERTLTEVNFLELKLGLKKSAKILDCPCGHGRHSIELARRGYNVTGQDINSFFLEQARRSADQAGVSVRLIQGDMRQIPFRNEFDLALNLFTAFGYLEDEKQDQEVLYSIANALKFGGYFVLDFVNRDWVMRNYQPYQRKELPDGSVIIKEGCFYSLSGRENATVTRIDPSGQQEVAETSLRLYSPAELVNMIRKTGLKAQDAYGSYLGEPVTIDSHRCILIAKK